MFKLIRTNSNHSDFINLVSLLDAELAQRDGNEHSFYAQFNSIKDLKHVIVLYDSNVPVGCGAIKEFNPNSVEIKRMYTILDSRGFGIATKILIALEEWADELGYTACILETGKRQPEAIALYQKNGYLHIPNYGQYIGIDNSVCFKKTLTQ